MAKNSYYFSHDFSARNDPKLQKLLRKHGVAGIGLYWCVVELLHEQDGYLRICDCEDVAFALHVDAKMLESLLRDFDLFSADAQNFWSDSALRRIEERKSKSQSARQSAVKRWSDANAMRTHNERTAIAKRPQSDGNAINESKEKKRELFASFYDAYDKKLDKAKAEKAWMKIDLDQMPKVIEAAKKFAASVKDKQFQPYPASWLNGERWKDEPVNSSNINSHFGDWPYGYDPQGNRLPAL